MRNLSGLALMLAWFALFACEPAPRLLEFIDQPTSVHALLRAGDDSAAVLLTRARSGTGLPDDATVTPIVGASVRLSFDGTTVALVPDLNADRCIAATSPSGVFGTDGPAPLRLGCYVAEIRGGIRAGQTYELLIQLPDGPVARGTAIVPAPPMIRSPEPGVVVVMNDLAHPTLVAWTTGKPADRVELTLPTVRPGCYALLSAPEGFGPWLEATARDSIAVNVLRVTCQTPEGRDDVSWDAELMVTVFDSTYARYTRETLRGEAVRSQEVAAGITGAIGVFAGAASARLPVVIRR